MKIAFTKMHGIGNDYIYINCMNGIPFSPEEVAIKMSPRHHSVGADGVILICRSDVADAKMRMFNADGSEGMMCGNGIRCVGKFVYDTGIATKEHISIETKSGIKYLTMKIEDGVCVGATVDMGILTVAPKEIPTSADAPMVNAPITVLGKDYLVTAIGIGNPHAVYFVPEVKSLRLEEIGPTFETLPLFPQKVNSEFIRVIDDRTLEMRVWERGSGETWACGTGACASVGAAILAGYCKKNTPVTVHLTGGDLSITVNDEMRVFMTGPAETVYEGVYTL